MRRFAHTLVLLAAATLIAAVLAACGVTESEVSEAEVSSASLAPAIDVAALAMDMSRKSRELAEDFPFQVPVLDGAVTEAEVVSPGTVWAYEIAAEHEPELAVEWYRQAYAGANWLLDREQRFDGDEGAETVFYFAKGVGAESVIVIGGDGGGGSVVRGTVGLGADLRSTY